MILTLEVLRKKYRQNILELADKYGATNIRVFGSTARGDSTDSSDVDFLIDMEDSRSMMDFVRLKIGLEDLLGHEVDLVEYVAMKPRLKSFIEKDMVLL